MIWKILSGLSFVCLAVGLYFSYVNKDALHEEIVLKARSEKNFGDIKQSESQAADAKSKRTKELEDLGKQRDDAKADVAKVNSDIDEKQKETDALKKTLEDAQKELAGINDQIQKAGNMKKLAVEVADLTKQAKESESAIANQEQAKALAEEHVKTFQDDIKKLQEVDARQRRGQVETGFTARVSQTYPGLGFVILNKGVQNGIFANTMLDVKRGKSVVAKLKVREVEPTGSVADVVPGSMSPDTTVQPGDLAVAPPQPINPDLAGAAPATPAPGKSAAPAMAPATAPAPAAPMTAPTMGADPFGAPAAPAAAAPAPAAPAPAPSAADPFAPPGAAAAPATPAKPSTADPFAPPAAK